MNLTLYRRFSTKKFHEILRREPVNIIPDSPEDTILSRFLTDKQEKDSKKMGDGFIKWKTPQK